MFSPSVVIAAVAERERLHGAHHRDGDRPQPRPEQRDGERAAEQVALRADRDREHRRVADEEEGAARARRSGRSRSRPSAPARRTHTASPVAATTPPSAAASPLRKPSGMCTPPRRAGRAQRLGRRRAVRSSAATAPTTNVTGGGSGAGSAASVPRRTRCASRLAALIAAIGVSGARPPSISVAAIRRMRPRPVRITSVPPRRASASQSGGAPCSGSSLPSTTVSVTLSWRSMSGIPAAAGAASAAETPGTTRTAMPASRSALASSPPREATNGSPLFRRTTASRRRPRSTSSALTAACGRARCPGARPTQWRSAPAGASATTSSSDGRS